MMNKSDPLAFQLQAAMFGTLGGLVIGLYEYLSRLGLELSGLHAILPAFGFLLFLLHVPIAVHRVSRPNPVSRGRIPLFLPICICFGLTAVAGMLPAIVGLVLAYLFITVGVIAFLYNLSSWLRARIAFAERIWCLLTAILLVAWTSAILGAQSFVNPLAPEALGYGSIRLDAWWFTALVSMAQTHGYTTIGVDGIPPLTYHVGAYHLYALWGNGLSLTAGDIYHLAAPLIVFPLFLSLPLLVHDRIICIWNRGKEAETGYHGIWFWLLFAVACTGFMPYPFWGQTDIFSQHVMKSLSHTMGVSGLFIVILVFLECVTVSDEKTGKISLTHWVMFILLLPLLVFVLGMFKGIAMALLCAMIGYFLLRLSLWRKPLFVALTLVCAIVSLYTLKLVFIKGYSGHTSLSLPWFHEPRVYWAPHFYLLNFSFTLSYVVLRCFSLGLKTVGDAWEALRNRRLLGAEFLVALACTGMMLEAMGGLHYSIGTPRWLSVPFFVSAVAVLPWNKAYAATHPKSILNMRLTTILALVFTATYLWGVGMDTVRATKEAITIQFRIRYADHHVDERLDEFKRAVAALNFDKALALFSASPDVAPLTEGERGRKAFLAQLRTLRSLPVEQRRKAILFIPRGNQAFWRQYKPNTWQLTPHFLPQAIAGIAMIEGLPDDYTRWEWAYGFSGYPPGRDMRTDPSDLMELNALKARAAEMGFDVLFILDQAEDRELALTRHPLR